MANQPNSVFAAPKSDSAFGRAQNNPQVQQMQQSAEDALNFQLWVSKQAHSLSRLKVFHSMAKSINDQQ